MDEGRPLPPDLDGLQPAFSLAPDRRSLLFVRIDHRLHDLMLAEPF